MNPTLSPTLSIIVPAYNVGAYIEQCVESILAQLQSWHELIVVDDGSTDDTLARVRALQASAAHRTRTNLRVLTQANAGIAVTRNNGIALATGEYIAFVDSDDALLAGALAALDAAIAEHRPDVIACDFRMWHPESEKKSRRVSLGYPAGTVLRDQAAILNTFFADRQMYVWANIFRRAIYDQLATPIFPPNRVFEDVATVPRLLSQCATLLYLPQAIIDYRQHPSSITRVITEKWCFDFAAALTQARSHLDERGLCPTVQPHFDLAAAHFYIGVVKNSYQLPRVDGRRVRAQIKPVFVNSLYGDCSSMLASAECEHTVSNDRRRDKATIRQVQSALDDSILFRFRQTASRKLKLWRRLRRTPK